MKSMKEWISLFTYLLIWFFSFELFDMYLKKYIDSEDKILYSGFNNLLLYL